MLRVLHAVKVVFSAEDAVEWAATRRESSSCPPGDITGGYYRYESSAQGILTVRGGTTSHAAVVARGMGTCCVSGCGDIALWMKKIKNLHLAAKTVSRRRRNFLRWNDRKHL